MSWFARAAGPVRGARSLAGAFAPPAFAAPGKSPPASPHLVRLVGVSKTYAAGAASVKALDDVSLTIEANEFYTLLGPSGCGKSTLLRMLAGFEHPTAGAVFLDGRDVSGDPPNRRPINIVFQSYALFPHMSVAQNIAFGLERLGWPPSEVVARVTDMLRLVHLVEFGSRFPSQLSGGQQQRVALARALAPSPRLLLLDEPMSALDVKLRREMQIELKRIQHETGITFLLVTHDQEEALSLASRISIMHEGRVVQTGAPAEIFERPANRFVAGFMGSNVLPGAMFGLSAPFIAIRPERVLLSQSESDGLCGRIVDLNYLGARLACRIALDAGGELEASLAPGTRAVLGQRVTCHMPSTALVELGA